MAFGPNSLLIDDILQDVVTAIGNGSAALVRNSQTQFGLLAVKTAEVSVELELSSIETKDGHQLAARLPLFFPVASLTEKGENLEVRNINKANITLQIVGVATTLEQEKSPSGGQQTGNVVLPGQNAAVLIGMMSSGIDLMVQNLGQTDPGPDLKKKEEHQKILGELKDIHGLLQDEKLNEASERFARLAKSHPEKLVPPRKPPDK
jgi:hypothetical protein